MITNLSIIKLFFYCSFNFSKALALNPPEALARPEVKIQKYQDVFDQIKNKIGLWQLPSPTIITMNRFHHM